MLKKVQIYKFMLILMGLTIPVFAANHYVDKNASGSNNGSSWSNAWESFGAIDWSSISSGDVIYISGGNDSTVYNETLNIGKSGVNGNRIVISKGTESGHNGEVIIDGGGSLDNDIYVNGKSYITISGFTVRKTQQGSIDVRYSDNIIVENCKAVVTGRAGVYLRQNTNSEVRGCNITTGGYVNTQTDGIYSQLNTDNVYHNNHIVVNNSEPTGHDDCIQSYQDNNLTIHSNYLEQNNSKPSNAQGLYIENPDGGIFKLYNNIVNMTETGSNGLTFRRLTGTGNVEMIGNTVYGENSATLLQTTEVDDPIIKNNIIYSGSTLFGARVINWNGNPANIDNNIIYVPNSNYVWGYNGSSKSWSQWRALGFDAHGKNSDPKFTSINNKEFSLQETSPGVDAGLAAGLPFNVDIMGVSRPQGQNYDMGAYEYNGGNPNPDTTPPDVISAEINSENAVIITFSEVLELNSAQTAGNYGITNGITVSSAILSTDRKRVTLATSNHTVGQSYIVTVNNVKDLAGNLINPNANTAGYSFFNDTTPPELAGASLSDSTNVIVMFSEEMDSATIGNKNNYSINNGITVNSVVVFSNKQKVMLSTSTHQLGTWYTLTVNNVEDRAGNLINPEKNTSEYHATKKGIDPIIGADGRWYENYSPGKAIDGNPDTTSNSRWGGAMILPDSITFDLGSVNKINEVRFSFYRWNEGRNYTYSVLTSPDGAKWTEAFGNGSSAPIEWSIDNFTAVDARYIKLVILSCNESQFAGLWEAEVYGPSNITGIESGNEVPLDFSLEQNYPNPFNPTTTINFNVPTNQQVKINIYNAIGELVTELVNKEYSAGNHSVEFNAANLPSGVYIYRMEAQSFTATHKMMLMK